VARSFQLPMIGGAGMGQAAIDARAVGKGVWSLDLGRYASTLSLLLQQPGARIAAHAAQAALPLEPAQLKTTVPNAKLTLTLTLATTLALGPTPTKPSPNPSPSSSPSLSSSPTPHPKQVPNAKATILNDAYTMGAAAPAKPQRAVPVESTSKLGREVLALGSSKRQPHVEALVLKVVRALTGSDDVIVASTPLMEAGIDSLAATELANQLREATGLVLSGTLVFEHPTPRAIAVHVLEELLGAAVLAVPMSVGASAGVSGGGVASGSTVAMCSVSGRFPGGCEGVGGALWSMMQASGDVTSITEEQKVCARQGGFLAGAERFDGKCFGVSPAESSAMDPQQRLVLEVAYEALHGAGARKASLLGDDAGVFLGIERPDWALLQALAPPSARQSVYAATGDTTSVAGGRLSFVLGLQEQRPPALALFLTLSPSLFSTLTLTILRGHV
jgi:acyl carrier protein